MPLSGDAAVLAVLAWLAAANAVGAVAIVADKRRARAGRGQARARVPEAALHAMALLGAWPGQLVAMAVARHKTRKPAFLVPFALCAAANAVLLAWLLAPALLRLLPGR